MRLNDNLKSRRNELNMTLEDVAAQLHVTRQTIQRYESGKIKNIPSDTIEQLAIILSTSPAWLMGWETKENLKEKQEKELMKKAVEDDRLHDIVKQLLELDGADLDVVHILVSGLKNRKQ